jgi:hypothetical protein
MRTFLSFAFLAALTFGSSSIAVAQAETTTTNDTMPISAFVGSPCTGEAIDITGDLHVITHTTISESGGFHFTSHLNYQGVSGIGRTSGTTYRATDAGSSTFNGSGDVSSANVITNEFTFELISQGPDDNFRIKGLFHTTVDANGQTTSEVTRLEGDCSG